MKEIFSEIFRSNSWGSEGSRSGPGSTIDRAKTVGPILQAVLERYRIRSLLDAPCGDFVWMKEVDLGDTRYIGLDIVPEVIQSNILNHSSPERQFHQADLSKDELPCCDLIFCRDCLVHFSFEDIFRTFCNFKRSGANYLLTTSFRRRDKNEDIQTGGWRPLNLLRAPFCLPSPIEFFPDWTPDKQYQDKSFGLWDLSSLEFGPDES